MQAEPPSPESWRQRAGVSADAVALLRASDVIDLHVESSVPARLYGYDLNVAHRGGSGPFFGRLFGHLDFPRALEAGLTGAGWSIATNVARTAQGRLTVLRRNVDALQAAVTGTDGQVEIVRTHSEYQSARARGAHAAFVAVQGGNAFDAAESPEPLLTSGPLSRVTLVHLTDSKVGATSAPLGWSRGRGLREPGRVLVQQLNTARVFVDLAHIHPEGFWDAVEVHDPSQPLMVSHTGVRGVRDHWRNLDDRQIRAVAETGGVVGILVHTGYLRRRGGPRDVRMVVEHLAHVVQVGGEDAAALGSDYDGFILPPPDLRDGSVAYVRLVQALLDAGWLEPRIQKVLGGNFLRALHALRP